MPRGSRSWRGGAFAILLVAALANAAAAGEDAYRLRAYIEPAGRITDTDPVNLVLQVEGSELEDVSVKSLPSLVNLRVVSGPMSGRSTSLQMSGLTVKRSATVTLTYTLLAREAGPAEIPPIAVRVGSEVRNTEPIRFTVEKGGAGLVPRSGPVSPRGGAAPAPKGEMLLRAVAEPTEVWVNQAISLQVTLYASGAGVERFAWASVPPLSNFWVEDQSIDPGAERFETTLNGSQCTAYPVLRKTLVPTTPGEFTLDPFTAQIQVRRQSSDLFQDFFFSGGGGSVVRKTEPIRLRVRSLPEPGRPDDFGGAVGSFRLRASLDRKDAQVNDAVALKVTVEGEGSLRSVPPPRLGLPPDVKLYEPKISESTTPSGNRLASRKTWEWVLVPLVPGQIRLAGIRFPYFDPAQGAYREAKSDPMLLAVRRSAGGEQEPAARGQLRAQRQDIAFIKPLRGRLADGRPRIHRRGWFLALVILPFALVPIVVVAGRRRARLRQDHGLARGHRARNKARRRLRSVARNSDRLDAGAFHEEIARALVEYVADRFNRAPAGMTYEMADDLLASRAIEPDLRGRFRTCLETCDFARFVPASGQAERKAEVLREALEMVELLEKQLS